MNFEDLKPETQEKIMNDKLIYLPISLIDSISTTPEGGTDIHCSNGHNYYYGADGLYNVGQDA